MAEEQNGKVFALAFNKARVAKGLLFADVAKRASISPNHVTDLSRGERRPGIDVLERICAAMQLEPWERRMLHRAAAIDQGYAIGGLEDPSTAGAT